MDQVPHLPGTGISAEGSVLCFEVLSPAGEVGESGNRSKQTEEEEEEEEKERVAVFCIVPIFIFYMLHTWCIY